MPESAVHVQPRAARRAPRWRLHAVYVALAVLGVAAVSLGLFLSDRAATLYRESVAVNQVWASRQLRYLALGPLAAAVNAPGNDVFDSGDVRAERARLAVAARALRPGLPILLVTGYAELPAGSGIDLPRLGKPYQQAQLAAAVAKTLEPRDRAAC